MNSLDKPTRSLDAQPVSAAGSTEAAAETANVLKPAAERPLVSPDRPAGPDELGRAEDAAFLAEVVLHRRLETPFCLGLFGAAGSGKTFFLNAVTDAVDRLGRDAGAPDGPLVGEAVVVRVDAARPGEPGALLADAVLERLAETHPALAAELFHAGADPTEAARTANTALDDLRRRHQAERATLDDLGSREARMVETVLDAPGTSLDAYARGHRSAIERALRQFGFDAADAIGAYKALVREAAESPGLPARLGLSLRALWSYRGQPRLLVLAVVFALLAWAVSALAGDGTGWVAALRGSNEKAGPLADWAQAHLSWLSPIHTVLLLLCVLALATLVWRATRFLRPIFKGAALLGRDLEARSRDLQGLLAHQTRRVDGLTADIEPAARHASEAERRAGSRPVDGAAQQARSPGRPRQTGTDRRASAVFDGLSSVMDPAAAGAPTSHPGRIVIAIDNLDARSSEHAAAVLDAARHLLGPGFVSLAAVNRTHLTDGFGEADPARAVAGFERCIQLGYRVDGGASNETTWSGFAARLIGTRLPARPAAASPEPRRSALDRPWRLREAETLSALAAFAGDTPRAIKRFVNVYRIARADPHLRDAAAPVFTALALALALDAHGFPDDLEALAKASHGEAPGESTVLRRALAVARDASGEPVELGQAQRGIDVASRYAIRG